MSCCAATEILSRSIAIFDSRNRLLARFCKDLVDGLVAHPARSALVDLKLKTRDCLAALLVAADQVTNIVAGIAVRAFCDASLHPILHLGGQRNVHRGHGGLLPLQASIDGKLCQTLPCRGVALC